MAAVDGRAPWTDFSTLVGELEHYGHGLAQRPFLVAANKMDLPESGENLHIFSEKYPTVEPIAISCERRLGLGELQSRLAELIASKKENAPFEIFSDSSISETACQAAPAS
jgi:GTP-binding protein